MSVTAIIQARTGSSRLPKKVLLPIGDKPMLQHVIERARRIRGIGEVCVATTLQPGDDAIVEICDRLGVRYYRGQAFDVLDRYQNAAAEFGAKHIMRITSDCPLLSPRVSEMVLREYLTYRYDYVSNVDPPTFPDGYDTEVFSAYALGVAWTLAQKAEEREHVTPFLRTSMFRRFNVRNGKDMSRRMLSVNTIEDLERVRALYVKAA